MSSASRTAGVDYVVTIKPVSLALHYNPGSAVDDSISEGAYGLEDR